MDYFWLVRLKAKTLAVSSFLIALACASVPVIGGENFEKRDSQYSDTKTASYEPIPGSECRLDKALKGSLYNCFFLSSNEDTKYPALGFVKDSDEKDSDKGDLLNYSQIKEASVILKYSNGGIKGTRLPVKFFAQRLRPGVVSEAVFVYLSEIQADLLRIKKLEVQFGSDEYSWIPDKDLVKKSLDYVDK